MEHNCDPAKRIFSSVLRSAGPARRPRHHPWRRMDFPLQFPNLNEWPPVVSSVSSSLVVRSTGNAISGTNFNGWDLGAVYGDDAQASTKWPIVRITNTSTG